jgi:DNA-binding LacI/PurR family transcriptional regulator
VPRSPEPADRGRPGAEPPDQPTMADIATRLGVSRQLVSLVLRDAPGASDATRARVLQAAAELGYRQHVGATTLRRAKSQHLGIAFTPAHATEPDIVESIYPAAAARGYHVVLSAQTPTRSTGQAVDELLGYRCAAVIVIGSDLGRAELRALAARARVPLVTVGAGDRNRYFDVVRSAGDVGIALAVHHLAQLRHRDIAYVHDESMPAGPLRLAGYVSAIDELGLRQRIIRIQGDYLEEAGAAAARELLASRRLPTAVAASNDQTAFGLMQVLTRAGVAIPDDVSVTGFDDTRVARLSSVDLTTARQDPFQMGDAAVAAAVRRIERPAARPTDFVVTPTLVVRGSTAAPPARGRQRVTARGAHNSRRSAATSRSS